MNIINVNKTKNELIKNINNKLDYLYENPNSAREIILYYFYLDIYSNKVYLNNLQKIAQSFDYPIKVVSYNFKYINYRYILRKIKTSKHRDVSGVLITNDIFNTSTTKMINLNEYRNILLEYETNCTVDSVVQLLLHQSEIINTDYPTCTIIGRNTLKRLALILQETLDYTVTQCISKTKHEDLVRYCFNSDIIISCTGNNNIINLEEIYNPNKHQLVIDCGYPADIYNKDYIDKYDNLSITSVPGGIGSLTPYITFWRLVNN